MKCVDSLESRSISLTPRNSKLHTIEASVPQGHHISARGDTVAALNQPTTDMGLASRGMHITHPIAGTSGTSLDDPVGDVRGMLFFLGLTH